MTPELMYEVIEATWPPAEAERQGPWMQRDGAGGGKRVSATTAEAHYTPAELSDCGSDLFMVRMGEEALDTDLEALGYQVIDPTVIYKIDVAELTKDPLPHVSAFDLWPPLAIQCDIWADAGIGPERIAVMNRATGAKTSILARHSDQPAGSAFVAVHENVAMIHAIEVVRDMRRKGVGANILRCAAHWAQNEGADTLALLVTRANTPANALYTSLNFEVVGHYHYRIK